MSDPKKYTVGWICALLQERVAAENFLDEKHDGPESLLQNNSTVYTLGRMGKHMIVIASLPGGDYGISAAGNVARDMLLCFPNVKIGLMVGIAGGAPSKRHDIRLGDIVVSLPSGGHSGVFQYDYGKTIQDQAFQNTKLLNRPSTLLCGAVTAVRTKHVSDGHQLENMINEVLRRKPRLLREYKRPEGVSDRLYRGDVVHPMDDDAKCSKACGTTKATLLERPDRTEEDNNPEIHYGLIASANTLMKDAGIRDKLAAEKDVLCFDMEAAGLMNQFPCLVIRGICDYADSHKNDQWQGYAAMVAAAYAKDLLSYIAPSNVEKEGRILDLIPSIKNELHYTKTMSKEIDGNVRELISDGRRNDMHKWLSPADPSTNYNKALRIRHRASGQWFLQSTTYLSWKAEAGRSLWLKGKAGCGKTILSSTIIENLKKASSSTATLLYFYFDFGDVGKQALECALRSLIYQLYCETPGVQNGLDSLYSSCHAGQSQPTIDSLMAAFQGMLDLAGDVQIVLDALDECPARNDDDGRGLLPWIKTIHDRKDVWLLTTSRPEQDIECSMNWVGTECTIDLESSLVHADICSFIRDKVYSDSTLRRWHGHPEIQEEVEKVLFAKADGMFRWVSCQIEALEKCLDPPTLRQALRELPKTLDETYARILQTLPSGYMPATKRLLQLLTYSKRPLRIEEAVDALAVDWTACPRFSRGNRMPAPEEISCYCSGLVAAVKRNDPSGGSRMVTEIQLSHFSVKEWLTSDRLEAALSTDFGAAAAHAVIARVCLAYLLELDPTLQSVIMWKLYPFVGYSVRHWAFHVAGSEGVCELVTDLTVELASDRAHYQFLTLGGYDNRTPLGNALCFTAERGLFHASRRLIRSSPDVNAMAQGGGTALHFAARGGHYAIVQMLLNHGVNYNALGKQNRTALEEASNSGHCAIVELLLRHNASMSADALILATAAGHSDVVRLLLHSGADANSYSRDHGFALLRASELRQDAIVRLLLAHGADVNQGNEVQGNALANALYRQRTSTVQLLIDRGARFDAQCGLAEEILCVASHAGHEMIVRKLLEQGVDVNAVNASSERVGEYALVAASAQGHEAIVRMLIEKGADIEVFDENYGTALVAASGNGRQDVVKLLLEQGADVNASIFAEDYASYDNALEAACSAGHIETIQLLFDHGADVTIQGGRLATYALWWAASNGHAAAVKLLLDQCASVRLPLDRLDVAAALTSAAECGQEDVVQLLLKTGAGTDKGSWARGMNEALCMAFEAGSSRTIELLLLHGADSNTSMGGTCDNKRTAAICCAIEWGEKKAVELLLEYGADVNRQCGQHRYPLFAAMIENWDEDIVEMLLKNGANVDALNPENLTALQIATSEGDETIIRLLLEHGADANATWGGNPSAVEIARAKGRDEVTRLLLRKRRCIT